MVERIPALLRTTILLFGVLSAVHPVSAGTGPAEDHRPYWRTGLFRRVLKDQDYLVRKWWPAELRNPAFSAPFLGATALALSSTEVAHAGSLMGTGDTRPAAEAVSYLGDGLVLSTFLGTSYLLSRRTGNTRFARASSLSAEALLSTGIWTYGLKLVSGRAPPGSSGQGFSWGGGTSFPSGHTAGAFAVATVFAHEYGDRRWVPWVAYGLAGLVGGFRVVQGHHFPSDVIAGALLGNSMGRMVLSRQRGQERQARQWITPLILPGTRTLGVAWGRTWGRTAPPRQRWEPPAE